MAHKRDTATISLHLNWNNGTAAGLNDEELEHAAMDMTMLPNKVRATIGSAERNDNTGTKYDLSMLALFSAAEHTLSLLPA